MSLEIEEPLLPDHPGEAIQESKRKAKISYSRDFLLSLSELDVCKKLPSGFDESALSDFNDAPHNGQDRQRISGNYPLQGFRRNEYGSSPPTRGDLNNHSRGIQGKWDSRPPGRTDKDSDSQFERDSDPGRRGDQSRWSWQNPEQHDGLLGSGSYPRPSGYAAVSAPKFGASDQHQINKSTEPYQPPRPYKATPHPRKDTKDSYNAETFGSFECTSQDRAEEERKRRAAFELMRKEQKELQEKQKLNLDQHKERPLSDMSALLEDPKDNKKLESVIESYPHNVSGKASFYSQAPASRPLVPPGFASTGPEKNLGIKPLTHSPPEGEVRNLPLEDSWLHAKDSTALNRVPVNQKENQSALTMGFGGQQFETVHVQHDDKGEKNLNLLSVLEVSNELIRMDEPTPYATSSALQPVKAVDDRNIIKLSNEKFMGLGNKADTVQDQSKTILEKLFDTALTINNGGSPRKIEPRDSKDGLWSSDTNQSSKFAPSFLQEEKRPLDGYSSGRSSDLLSIIVGGSKDGPRVSEMKSMEQILPGCPFDNSGIKNDQMKSNMLSSTVEISDQLCSNNISDKIPPVLTCEDLEQSILSGINEYSSDLSIQGCSLLPQKPNQPTRSASDDHASQHLLSLLQKGAGLQEIVPTPNHDMALSERQLVLEAGYTGTTAPNNSKMENAEKVHDSGSALTLETLFGSAFMKELQDSVGSARIDVSEPHAPASSVVDGVHFPRTANGIGSSRSSYEGGISTLNNKQETKLGNIEGHWLPDDPQQQMNSMNIPTEVGAKPGGFDTEVEFHLPEEESLLTGSDPAGSSFIPPMNATKPLLSSFPNMPVEIGENLIALDARIRDERPLRGALDGPPFWHNPHNLMESEIPHQNIHPQPSQLLHPQVNHGRPLLHPLISHAAHINPQMKFMPQGSSMPHNVPPAHQLPGNMLGSQIQHPKTALSSFDHANYHPLLQKMHMLDNFPPPHGSHLLPGFSRGAALPSQPNNRPTGFTQDANMMNNFQFGHQNPNLGNAPPMPMPAPDVAGRSSHPEALQRLFNMEFRSNSNQMSPFSIAGHAQGLQGDGLDIGFRYR